MDTDSDIVRDLKDHAFDIIVFSSLLFFYSKYAASLSHKDKMDFYRKIFNEVRERNSVEKIMHKHWVKNTEKTLKQYDSIMSQINLFWSLPILESLPYCMDFLWELNKNSARRRNSISDGNN